jgi:hypothetical protein
MGMAFNGLGRPSFNPNQRFGDGYDPITGTMSLSGSGGASSSPDHSKARRIAGIIGDTLAGAAGRPGPYAQQMHEAQQQQMLFQRQVALAQWKQQHPDPTGTMQNAQATGALPGTPDYQDLIRKTMMAPHYITLGNAENGQTVIDANNMGSGNVPPDAVARLKANPHEAAQFDEIFGPGAAARAMGGQ